MAADEIQIFESFYEIFVHPEYYLPEKGPDGAQAVVWVTEGGETETFRCNSEGCHVEINVIRELRSRNPESVTMYSNLSPCWECSPHLIQFKTENPGVELNIKFANLYNIKRYSCSQNEWEKYAYHNKPRVIKGSEQNKQGLRNLRDADIGLSTFTEGDWEFLYTELGVLDPREDQWRYGRRRAEDERMAADLQHILG